MADATDPTGRRTPAPKTKVPNSPGVYQRGDTFTYVLRDATGRQVWRTKDPATGAKFKNAREAKAARAAELTDRRRRVFVEPDRATVAAFLTEWLEGLPASDRAPGTIDVYKAAVNAHLIPHLGHLKLSDLDTGTIERFAATLLREGRRDGKGGLAPKTVRNVLTTLHSALEAARRHGRILRNPAADAEGPSAKRDPEKLRYWDADQLHAFLDHAHATGDRLAPLWTLLAATGMRRGEALALRWSDLTPAGVKVTKARTEFAGAIREGKPKSDRSRRTVTLDPASVALLTEWRHVQESEHAEAERLGVRQIEADPYVFADEIGLPLHPAGVSRIFDAAVKASGVLRISLHGLRHTHATGLLAAGVPVEVVSKRLGHASVVITLEAYRHVLPAEEDKAAAMAGALVHGGRPSLRSVG